MVNLPAGAVERSQVQLIAYADRLGGSLAAIGRLLDGPLGGLFGGVHVLPFYRPYDGADAGFDPDDHLAVDPRLGGWPDLRRLASSHDVVADVIVNHVSDRSAEFRDVVRRGEDSPYAGMFLTFDAAFPKGATETDLALIVRPRPGLPFTPVDLGGRRRLLWTTFTPHQIDLDVRHPLARRYLSDVLGRLAASGVAMVRLDAIGYTVKAPATTCFLTPETLDFVDELTAEAHDLGMKVLAEVHAPGRYAAATAARVDHVYDFVLAPLVLHAVLTGDCEPLTGWLASRPDNAVTVLDTHDGIGLVDAGPSRDGSDQGQLSSAQLEALVAQVSRNSAGTSRASMADGLLYQLSCTLYDAVGRDDRRWLLARLVQLFTPGIPQVYYVGLLAGTNQPLPAGPVTDHREIHRRRYTEAQVAQALQQPGVAELTRLIRLRSGHPAFTGEFTLPDVPRGELALAWRAGDARAQLWARLADASYRVSYTVGGEERTISS